jgi:uncharacterized protein
LLCCFVNAQNVKPVNSGELISKGVELHDQGKYKDAIELYRKVPRNETNYVKALYELAYSSNADSNSAEALRICETGLSKDDGEYGLDFLLLIANMIDDNGDHKSLWIYTILY